MTNLYVWKTYESPSTRQCNLLYSLLYLLYRYIDSPSITMLCLGKRLSLEVLKPLGATVSRHVRADLGLL